MKALQINTDPFAGKYEQEQDRNRELKSQIHSIPTDLATDEGVGSPSANGATYEDDDGTHENVHQQIPAINNEACDSEEFPDEYHDDDGNCVTPSQQVSKSEELASLSRQSMVPIQELIAYYQCIQHSDQHHLIGRATTSSSASTSRQSSSASQLKTRAIHSDDGEDELDESNVRLTRNKRAISDRVEDDDGTQIDRELPSANLTRASDRLAPIIVIDGVESSIRDGSRSPESVSGSQTAIAVNVQDRSRLRANVVLELIKSERDFVKHLEDVVDGYLHRARKHPEIFTGQRINSIFANIEQLYEFQRKFLEDLELCINWDDLAKSEVGHCFLKYEKGFSVYHYYCNNHPNAISELQDLYTKPIFRAFFEECRLKRNMIDISLDGFLLTPIQRICKYPLQLTELLKNTDASHPDYRDVSNALISMRNCANLANERKRRIEALADVMSFQEKVDNWFGPKLSDTSSILVHSGEVSKMTSHTWSQGVQLFLFDHLLLYSKRDLLKRNNLILKGRISMDSVTEISDADEYKPRKSFKLYCGEQQKWFVFTTKSEKEKDEWIRAFERERNLVEADENEGFHITDRELGIARRTLQHRKRSRSARYRNKRPDTAIVDQLETDDPNLIINRTLSLPSYIHPSHVMNFVEDSRIVSTTANTASGRGKKSASPSSNSRSPMASSQHLAEHPDHQSGPTNWLRKMGSKKLTKSQVYNISGQTSQNHPATSVTSQHRIHPAACNMDNPTSMLTSANVSSINPTGSLNSDVAAIKYEELERRHRDHMVSEEQARLYRLNNDLPPPTTLYPRSITPTHPTNSTATSTSNNLDRWRSSSPHQLDKEQPRNQHWPHLVPSYYALPQASVGEQKFDCDQRRQEPASIGQNTSEQQDNLESFCSLSLRDANEQAVEKTSATFETELVLSSGRVVRVREDAV